MEFLNNYKNKFGITSEEDQMFCDVCDSIIEKTLMNRFSIEYYSMILTTLALAVEYDACRGTLDGLNNMCHDMREKGIAIVDAVELFKAHYIIMMSMLYRKRWSREEFEDRMELLLSVGSHAIDSMLEHRLDKRKSIRFVPDAGVAH